MTEQQTARAAESAVERARQLLAAAMGDSEDGNDGTELFDMFVDSGGDVIYWPDGDAVAHVYPGVMTGVEPRALAALIAAAPTLLAELCAIIDQHTRWKTEATEVIESWELVYEALGDVGGLGQRRSEAVLAEVLRMKAELDQHTDPDLAARLLRITQTTGCIDQACDCDECSDLRAAARKLGGAT